MPNRDASIRIRCSEDEVRLAHELAEAEHTTVSEFLRRLIRQLHAERVAPPKARAKRRSSR